MTARLPRPTAIPMMRHNRQHLELTFYADLVRFISDPTPLAYTGCCASSTSWPSPCRSSARRTNWCRSIPRAAP
ncbi:hypothetical protein [Cupriavidus oxalaticus]|uniref:hypothetical protein n=1 Tax=Cupriavidus oxalaticus TaxID=96344 RepID=UPI003F73D5CF